MSELTEREKLARELYDNDPIPNMTCDGRDALIADRHALAEALREEVKCQTCEGTGMMSTDCHKCDEEHRSSSCNGCQGSGIELWPCAECEQSKVSPRCTRSLELLDRYDRGEKLAAQHQVDVGAILEVVKWLEQSDGGIPLGFNEVVSAAAKLRAAVGAEGQEKE